MDDRSGFWKIWTGPGQTIFCTVDFHRWDGRKLWDNIQGASADLGRMATGELDVPIIAVQLHPIVHLIKCIFCLEHICYSSSLNLRCLVGYTGIFIHYTLNFDPQTCKLLHVY